MTANTEKWKCLGNRRNYFNMGVYQGLQEIIRRNIKIGFNCGFCRGYIAKGKNEQLEIRINLEDPIAEQIRTFMHETLHLSPEFKDDSEKPFSPGHPTELKIEAIALTVYDFQPVLVATLRDYLSTHPVIGFYEYLQINSARRIAARQSELFERDKQLRFSFMD